MGQFITLTAADGHSLSAYEARPRRTARGGVVVLQEIFGVNQHIRKVADGYAAAGYHVIAPSLFDRLERNVELLYGEQERGKAITLRKGITLEQTLLDVEAAVKAATRAGKVGVVGYCWGGTLAWLAAARIAGVAAVSSYYGGGIGQFAGESPKCPVQLHFGEKDQHIPLAEADKVSKAQPAAVVYIYPAEHGFNCDERPMYHAESAALARERTLSLFAKCLV